PLGVDSFFDEQLERGAFHLVGGPGHVRRRLLGADPARTVLDAHATHATKLSWHAAAPAGRAPEVAPADGPKAFLASIEQFHALGYTVRFAEVGALAPALARFMRALEFLLHQPVKASLFWSAAGARAPVHYDDNDNVVIQLTGRKRWLISAEPPSLHNAWRDVAEGTPALIEPQAVDLDEGDLLYVPRGTPHTVISETESLHLAIVFTPVTLREVIIAALDHLSDDDRALREKAIGRHDAGVDMVALSARVGAVLDGLQAAARSPEFLTTALQRRSSRVIGGLERLVGASPPPLTPYSRVRHSPLAMCHMLATPGMIDFCQPGEHINVHRGVEPALRFISVTPSFRVADLPGEMADEVRVALVGRLVTSGFLEVLG
ncbi:MAG: hypothetical protein EOP59_07805, partial [Sphingomonadales bacterium]